MWPSRLTAEQKRTFLLVAKVIGNGPAMTTIQTLVTLPQPIQYGNIATGEYFTNRVSELRTLESDMRSGQNVVIISPRRYGKTALVRKALDAVRQDGLLTAYIDLFNTPTKERMVQLLADAIFKGLESPFEQLVKAAKEIFRNLSVKPVFTLGDDGKPVMELAQAARAAAS